jgi:polysaccharide chain length determinant protein (PEP-CTERM system associated)
MSELLQELLASAKGMWYRRWIGLVAAWIVALVAVGIVYRIPERYEASARLYVDTETLLKPLLQGLSVQPSLDQQVALISRTLISRPNVEQLIRMADLDLGVRTGAEREDLIDHVTKAVQLTGNTSTNLYVISYRDPAPEVAKKVVQSLLTIFVESSLGDKRQDSRTAVQFLDDQIKRYEQTLKAAEDRLKEFKLKYLGVSTQQGQDYFTRLSQLRAATDAARLDLSAAEQSRDTYKRQLAEQRAGETAPSLVDDTNAQGPEGVSEVDRRIAALQQDLDKLLRRYTEEHPDVVATRRLIANLEQQRRAELAARKKAGGGQSTTFQETSPVVQQLKISLADAEADVASARAKVDGYEAQYRQWQARAQLVPQAEAEYAQLNRDYEVQKKTYDSLLTRRAAAGMGMDVQDTGGARFRVIDPPRVSPEPVAPTRVMLLGIACVVSIGAGLAASLVASQLRPIFHDAKTLREISNRPVLGMVSMLPSEALTRLRRRNAYLFAGGLGVLLVSLSGVVAFALLFGRVA